MEFKYLINNHLQRNSKVPPHAHSCYEFIYYLEADGKIQYDPKPANDITNFLDFNKNFIDDIKELFFHSQTFIIIPPSILHNEINYNKSNVVCIGFVPNKEERDIINEYLLTSYNNSRGIDEYVNKIKEEFYAKKQYYDKLINLLLNEMLIHISRLSFDTNDSFSYILSYIDEYYMTDIKIEDLASQAGYSVSYFRARFQKKFGVSIKQYILNKRLEYAKSALVSSTASISDIATIIGFTDYFHFSSFFKKKTGLSPKEYRNKYKT